ncbi:hypothetical protein GGS23DRAFT_599889 [Durotheca rogersii]|uniref:uncharacterized protein n=1 Tax=Durotheca rogersii TaxID=419775 RepID=UPI0022207574|nr:uncharacterized protein GGS23DRAFT_599889 [Durotheca rogersii]KAI5859958.1 hypothetical protein GGS23DRAFT_599889 [Durotheca rogersii]
MVAGILSLSRIFTRRDGARSADARDRTEFFGSQVGDESVINYCYTDMPWKLMAWDMRYFFTFVWFLPWIVWPLRPCDGGHFDELSLSGKNILCMAVHAILFVLQSIFILTLPLAFLFPVWVVVFGTAVFFSVNWLLCLLLNGNTITFTSDPKYAPALEEHAGEQWIFLNGVAVGETWLRSNINRLALTFKRPVIGVHNRTTGIIFDVVECLVQRNFGYATSDVRAAYKIVKEKLYNPQYTKVVFILHSQGGIEGGLVLDWLLQELPHNLLAKLEVYTFGNASNHFNNPHRDLGSYHTERDHARMGTQLGATIMEVPLTHSPSETRPPSLKRQRSSASTYSSFEADGHFATLTNGISKRATYYTAQASERALAHVEHYAHTTDFVALWGILHFVTNERASPEMPRYIGRVFSRTSSRGGHQFCQHYLNGMFPLERDSKGEFVGCAESNDFMDSVIEVAEKGSAKGALRERFEYSWSMLEIAARQGSDVNDPVEIHGSIYEGKVGINSGKVRVKDLSRLWQYRNGRSPPDVPKEPWRRITLH